ncbi:hypothetical protein lb338_phage_177 [Lactobacillus phage Lb338-1]|uniref:YopX protein domain-containing protein n=1 Tax=Lactobacillus phage Lb338-1 TaxID=2892342 RepID=C1KFT7_9CAUD|nr:hypothetical protein lb338_phage_177 [Lactobacillus phage Lb338-1]ACO37098.1 hypothetical protein lb338_phage_177 [Lactobacillus phage Lb338-1]
MKREVKFRAWDKVHACYLYDVQNAYDTLSGCVKDENGEDAGYDEECFAGFLDNDKYVVEQYTDLTDANGKKIYEGDIVEVISQYWGMLGSRYEVKFRQGAFCAKYVLLSEIAPSISVIGNVHEKPELLEEDK